MHLLLEHGANVNKEDIFGKTPLIEATRGGHLEIVRLLLENGADVDAKNSKGKTVFSYRPNDEIKSVLQEAREKAKADAKAERAAAKATATAQTK